MDRAIKCKYCNEIVMIDVDQEYVGIEDILKLDICDDCEDEEDYEEDDIE